MKVELTREEMAALAVLKSAGEDLMEVAIIAKEAMEAGRGKLKRARKCIAAGVEELKKQERTVTFEKAVAFALEARRKGRAISAQEIKDLWQTASTYQNGSCAAAVGMMLYAGIRPHEVVRLTWAQVDLRERAIYILPRHSKKGGARRVTIHKPLMKILRRYQGSPP